LDPAYDFKHNRHDHRHKNPKHNQPPSVKRGGPGGKPRRGPGGKPRRGPGGKSRGGPGGKSGGTGGSGPKSGGSGKEKSQEKAKDSDEENSGEVSTLAPVQPGAKNGWDKLPQRGKDYFGREKWDKFPGHKRHHILLHLSLDPAYDFKHNRHDHRHKNPKHNQPPSVKRGGPGGKPRGGPGGKSGRTGSGPGFGGSGKRGTSRKGN